MKPLISILVTSLSVGCIQNTYEYPDCENETEEPGSVSDIPTPSQDVEDSNSNDSDSTGSDTQTEDDVVKTTEYFYDILDKV